MRSIEAQLTAARLVLSFLIKFFHRSFRGGLPLFSSLAEPLESLDLVWLGAFTFLKADSEIQLGVGVTLFRRFAKPFDCLMQVLLHAFTFVEANTNVELELHGCHGLQALRNHVAASRSSFSTPMPLG
jgi:hypothetical protein